MSQKNPNNLASQEINFYSRGGYGTRTRSDSRTTRPVPLDVLPADPLTIYPDPIEGSKLDQYLRGGWLFTTQPNGAPSPFYIFQTYPTSEPWHSRSGYIGSEAPDGHISPLKVELPGSGEYFVEAKGVGNATGNYHSQLGLFFQDISLGGLPWADAQKEYEILQRLYEAGQTPLLPFAVGRIALKNEFVEDEELGIVLRLTPSPVRLSYRGHPDSLPIDDPEAAKDVVLQLVNMFLDKFLQKNKLIYLSQASHLDNYVVTKDGQILETDFEDFHELGTHNIPFVHLQSAQFIDTKKLVSNYFDSFERLENYNSIVCLPEVIEHVTQRLKQAGIVVDLSGCQSLTEVGNELWGQWLLELDFQSRLETQYRPQAMLDFAGHNQKRMKELLPQVQYTESKGIGTAWPDKYLKEVARQVRGIQYVHTTKELSNSQRGRYFKGMRADIDKILTSQQLANEGRLPLETCVFVADYYHPYIEFSSRIFRVLDFYQQYLESELAYLSSAVVMTGNDSVLGLIATLENMKQEIMEIMNSTDHKSANTFVLSGKLVARIEYIDRAWQEISG